MGSLRRDESGAVAVMVALCITALMGFAASAVDFGMMASGRQALQNAADAAALAAAADLGDGESTVRIQQTAYDYCAANGFDRQQDDVQVDVRIVNNCVEVTVSREMRMGFSSVLTGKKTRTVRASATAEAVSIFGGCPYAMFAGQRIEEDGSGITVTGNNIEINGNIHSNSDISMQHAVLGGGAVATAVRTVNPSTTGWNGNSIALDMPSFRSFQRELDRMPEVVKFSGDVEKKSKTGFQELIDEAIARYHETMGHSDEGYRTRGLFIEISGSLTFRGNNSTAYTADFPIILVVGGDIDLNGAPLNSTKDFPVAIMSEAGDITVNGGGADFTGILYAPKGNVILNGNDAEFTGSIVAQNIRKAGGKITVSYSEEADDFLPVTKVHLIR